jgi:hypothetical protein
MMRRNVAMVAAAVLAAGCGGSPHPTAGPTVEIARAVFFVAVDGELAPLACFDGATGRKAGGEACLDLVPAGAHVKLGDGTDLAVGARGAIPCAVGGTRAVGLAAPGLRAGSLDQYALWSTGPAPVLEPFARPEPGQVIALPGDELARVSAAVSADAPGPPIVTQALDVDLDGDGRLERIYSVHVLKIGEEDDLEFAFSGLLYGAAESGALAALVRSDGEVFTVLAAFSLDGGPARSLFIDPALYEGTMRAVVRESGGALETVGQWSCGR